MARDRLALQAKLRQIAPKAWYRRPPDNKMTYPCFIYRLSRPSVQRADNKPYIYTPCYNVIYILSLSEVIIPQAGQPVKPFFENF